MSRTKLGVDANIAGLLAYTPLCCVGLLFSIAIVAVEKENRSVRFHAFQSLLLHAAAMAVSMVVWILSLVFGQVADVLGFLATMMGGIVLLALAGVMILLMMKAYQGEEFQLPYVGEMARKWV
jgi:uncharacterized membrane protein